MLRHSKFNLLILELNFLILVSTNISHSLIIDVTLSSDFMTGFCGETEEEHSDTISLMKLIEFDMAYMFAYSMRKVCYFFCSWLLNELFLTPENSCLPSTS